MKIIKIVATKCQIKCREAAKYVHRRSSSHRDPLFLQRCPNTTRWITDTTRYDTIAEFNVDSKAEYTA